MKVIFAGTPAFAVPTLEALIDSEHELVAVYTQPDRPSGRGRKLTPSPVKALALTHKLPVYQPVSLKSAETQTQLRALEADVMVVVAYGLLLPKTVLATPRLGCVNIHPSLLPRWRGAAPIQHTILAGDEKTAVTTMLMDAGMDTGPILLQTPVRIQPLENSAQLHDRLAHIGATLLLETLAVLPTLTPTPQSDQGVTLASKITKADAQLKWSLPAITLQRAVCAYNPWPVAFTDHAHQVLRIWEAEALPSDSLLAPGTVIAASKTGIDIATGEGMLRLHKVQLPGGRQLSAAEYYNKMQSQLVAGETRMMSDDQ